MESTSQIHDSNLFKNAVTLESFITICVLGKGSYAKVLLVKKKDTEEVYAMKILSKKKVFEKNQERHVITEKEILAKMNKCPFLVRFYHSFQTPKKLFFVLEYCPGGELFNLIQKRRRLTESQTRFFACQIVLALEAMHKNDIIYRDLKPENVLIDADGYIKITDFGLSRQNVVNNDAKSICGTPEYLAPEVISRLQYGKPVDWWTLGCIIFEMVTGLPPFYRNNRQELFEGIKYENPKLPSTLTNEGRSLIAGLLNKDPTKRLGAKGAFEIKEHPWFFGVNWTFVLEKKYEAPFKVKVGNDLGIENFDKMFTTLDPESIDKDEDVITHRRLTNFSWDMDNSSRRQSKVNNAPFNIEDDNELPTPDTHLNRPDENHDTQMNIEN